MKAAGFRLSRFRDTYELGGGYGWVVDISVWFLHTVEGGTLVLVQSDTKLNAQWQVRLETGCYHTSI